MTERFERALAYAARLHRDQCRKGADIPYISHLLAVTSIVLEQGADEDESIAALFHDAIEDVGGDVSGEIRERFGERVLEIVRGCSDCDQFPKPPWQERKLAFLASLATADRSVLLVATADKLHNARTLLDDYRCHGEDLWLRFRGGREGTLWYYRAFVDALGPNPSLPLVAELDRVVGELEAAANRAPRPVTESERS